MRIGSLSLYLCRLRGFLLPGHLRIGRRAQIRSGATIDAYRGRVVIGDRFKIHKGGFIDAQKGSIEIGSNVSINPYSILYGLGGIKIGNDVRIAAHVVIVSFDHRYDDVSKSITMQGVIAKPIVIEDDVWIGAGAKVLGLPCGQRLCHRCECRRQRQDGALRNLRRQPGKACEISRAVAIAVTIKVRSRWTNKKNGKLNHGDTRRT